MPSQHTCVGAISGFCGKKKLEVRLVHRYVRVKTDHRWMFGSHNGLPSLKSTGCTGRGVIISIDGGLWCNSCEDVRKLQGNSSPVCWVTVWYRRIMKCLNRRTAEVLTEVDIAKAKSFSKIKDVVLTSEGMELRAEALEQARYGDFVSKTSKNMDMGNLVMAEASVPGPRKFLSSVKIILKKIPNF